jgi:cytochrome c553
VADHVVNVTAARAAGWDDDAIDDPANGAGVCASCHDRKTALERAAGRARAQATRSRNRPPERHPGLRDP